MKYDLKWPEAKLNDEPEENVVKLKGKEPCWNCGDVTEWWNLAFDAPLCSEECLQKKVKEYFEACNKD